ncbi:MAG: aminoglycoside phosphotransferase family protein [Gaiellaceae bacterium]
MHADEVDTDPSLVQRLVAAQFPQWAELKVEPVLPRGTDNANYRLGEHLLARLPRRDVNLRGLAKELEWLPRLARLLPLDVPQPVASGEPGEGFPFPWAVYTWVEGDGATADSVDAACTAADLAAFVTALRRVDADGAPRGLRRGALRALDEPVRAALAKIADRYDTDALVAVWEAALGAPEWDGPPTWCHCDLDLRNVLFAGGRPSGVLDFGGAGIGDPASDDALALKVLPAGARNGFWSAVGADEASIVRARGWTVFQCAMALSYYTAENNPALYFECERWVTELGCGPTRSADPRA